MPIGALYKAGKKAVDAYKDSMSAKGSDPEIPVPGRTPSSSSPVQAAPMSNKAKVNRAADVLNVPGRDVVRGAMAKRKKMLDDI